MSRSTGFGVADVVVFGDDRGLLEVVLALVDQPACDGGGTDLARAFDVLAFGLQGFADPGDRGTEVQGQRDTGGTVAVGQRDAAVVDRDLLEDPVDLCFVGIDRGIEVGDPHRHLGLLERQCGQGADLTVTHDQAPVGHPDNLDRVLHTVLTNGFGVVGVIFEPEALAHILIDLEQRKERRRAEAREFRNRAAQQAHKVGRRQALADETAAKARAAAAEADVKSAQAAGLQRQPPIQRSLTNRDGEKHHL